MIEGPENKFEKEPQHNIVIADFIRHGETEYKNHGLDLTTRGVKQVAESAKKIAESIDKEKDIVIIWNSPATRAQGSGRILRQVLREHDIEIHSVSEIRLMRNCDVKDEEYSKYLFRTMKLVDIQRGYAKGEIVNNNQFEPQESVKKRAGRVYAGIASLARSAELQGKRLRIIGASHFEFLNPIMEDIFGCKMDEGEEMRFSEDLRLVFDFEKMSKKMNISADFRHEHKENIQFDEKSQHFQMAA